MAGPFTEAEVITRWGGKDSAFSGANAPEVSLGTTIAGESLTTTPQFLATNEAGFTHAVGGFTTIASAATAVSTNLGITLRRLTIYNPGAVTVYLSIGAAATVGTTTPAATALPIPAGQSLTVSKYAAAGATQMSVILASGAVSVDLPFVAEGTV